MQEVLREIARLTVEKLKEATSVAEQSKLVGVWLGARLMYVETELKESFMARVVSEQFVHQVEEDSGLRVWVPKK